MSYLPADPDLRAIAERLPPETWAARVAAADEEARLLAAALERVRGGESRRVAFAELAPDGLYPSLVKRLQRFEEGGRDALIDRRAPRAYRQKVTDEVLGSVRVLAHLHPELHSAELAAKLQEVTGVALGGSTMREVLRELALPRRRGRPTGGGGTGGVAVAAEEEVEVTVLALAGAELLIGLEAHVGAVRSLTEAVGRHLEALPAPEGEVADDRDHRDGQGRFQASYNRKDERTDPDLGARFGSVAEHRKTKDLPAMQVVGRSPTSRYRKDLTLFLLPVVVDGPRWSALRHWRGQHLEELVGVAYQPATLDKYTRELKHAGASEAARDALAAFWLGQEGVARDPITGAAVLYADGSTKPLWTDHYTRSTKVSKTGRVQPATTTLMLNSGAGTPLIFEAWSGGASLPQQVLGLLARWEKAAGAGTARRLLVVDRECHSAALFKALDEAGVLFIVPVRRSSAGPTARWEELGPWEPLDVATPDGPELREAKLWLNDSKARNQPLQLRAITRRRGADDDGATWATNAPHEEFAGRDILRLYGSRWAHQEHVFRDANGAVGLDAHHGYGKHKVTNVAVVDRLERLQGKIKRANGALEPLRTSLREAEQAEKVQAAVNDRVEARRAAELAALGRQIQRNGPETAENLERYQAVQAYERALPLMRAQLQTWRDESRRCREEIAALEADIAQCTASHAAWEHRTEIYTVDVELDEIMTAYKLSFLNLAHLLMRDYLDVNWQVDTLIRSVLTLPGERHRTASTETVRIYHQPRDPAAMRAVELACERLNALQLTRGEDEKRRHLRFELEPLPVRGDPARAGSG